MSIMTEPHFWIGVASREHVRRGVELGIAQFNHGKRPALARMHQGDWLLYYSPRESYPSGPSLQAWTAIGQITSTVPQLVTHPDGWQAFCHTVRYLPCGEVAMREVLAELTFLPDKHHWGAVFRFGHRAIPRADFQTIAGAMGIASAQYGENTDVALSI